MYDGDDLFNQSNCSNATGEVGGNVLTPIITVTNEDSNNSEVVTISFSHVTTSQGHTIRCVRWIPFDCEYTHILMQHIEIERGNLYYYEINFL